MTATKETCGTDGPSESFVDQVKDALEHLYDLSHLQHHPLAREKGFNSGRSVEMTAQRLRRELVAAIEALDPGEGIPIHAPDARIYNLLALHYMQSMTVKEAAYELGISERHAYRGLRQGEECVAEVLWGRQDADSAPAPEGATIASLQEEMDRLEAQPHPIDLSLLLQSSQEAVEVLAAQQGISFRTSLPERSVIVSTNPTLAEQLFISLFSHASEQSQPGEIEVALKQDERRTFVTLHYTSTEVAASPSIVDQMTLQLADQLEWTVSQEDQTGDQVVTLQLTDQGFTLLVIDDNEGLVELVERYLANQASQLIAATSAQEGLKLAQEEGPDAIMLDIMMPGMHGWQVLQRLQNHPETADIPVIVCSVIDIPELAQALGAVLFLSKPISQEDVLGALHQVGLM